MDLSGGRWQQDRDEYGTVQDLCAQLHSLVEQLATLHQAAALWALVVMARHMLGDAAPPPRYVLGYWCTFMWCALLL